MTADDAYTRHIEMWTAMRDELGDNPSAEERSAFKWHWCITHDVYPFANCFLCQYVYDVKGGCSYIATKDCETLCPVDWGYNERFKCGGCALGKTQYDTSPISEILALPRREGKQ